MSEQAIVTYTEIVASDLATKFEASPLGELRAWIGLAHQREAMVTELYQVSDIGSRLKLFGDGTAALIRSTILSIWAHEESHTRFLGSLRSVSEILPELTELQGKLEGRITRGAVSGGILARILIAIGASLQRVPEFARDLGQMNVRDLVRFHGELETTARLGYQRMLELTRVLRGRPEATTAYGQTFPYDLAKILAEERFHEDAFGVMATWVAPGGDAFMDIAPAECANVLHDLCERNLSVAAVRRAVYPEARASKGGEPGGAWDAAWVSDGGLGQVFSNFGLAAPVLAPEAARALVNR